MPQGRAAKQSRTSGAAVSRRSCTSNRTCGFATSLLNFVRASLRDRDAGNLVELSLEEQIHREVYVAILNSALREVGSKAQLAQRLGISRAYLSYLLHPDPRTSDSFRRPSERIAEHIARALPVEQEVRDALLEHMLQAHISRIRRQRILAEDLSDESVNAKVASLRALHGDATFADPATNSRMRYRVVLDASREFLGVVSPSHHPLAWVELCFLIHDAQCVLNHPDDALYHAKRARAVLALLRPDAPPSEREQAESYKVQALRAEAVAYHNMRLFRQSYRATLAAEQREARRQMPDEHLPHILRDRIAALAERPRFTLGEVEGLADRAVAYCERRSGPLDAMWAFMIRRSQAHAFIVYGNLRRAGQLLASLRDQAATTPRLGPLHRVMFLKTDAYYWRQIGDLATSGRLARQAHAFGETAGLSHQLAQVHQLLEPPSTAATVTSVAT